MANKRDNHTPMTDMDDIEIFGAHKTREQIKAEEKARKQAQREALRREIADRRAAAKTEGGAAPRRFDVWSVLIVVAVIVLLGAGALALQFGRAAKEEQFQRDETRTEYFLASSATPEMREDGVTAAVSEVFYTKGGYLCVHMVLGNGTANPMELNGMEVVLINGEEQQIAGGYADITSGLTVPAGGTEEYTFFISPEFITLKDDPLTTLGYTINVTATPQ